ncbi:urease alpha subunit [Kitasatospora sp. MAP5-34]|nr:urease alpha subunit [Kitasatospora sp. MAP5-34]
MQLTPTERDRLLLFGAHGAAPADLSVAFVSQAAADSGSPGSPHDAMTTRRRRVAVRGTRGIGPADLVHNARLGQVEVDPRSGLVTLDGAPVRSEPTQHVPLSRLYFL